MNILSESRTFLGLTPEWAGVMVSAAALIFAALGYRQLIKSKGDTDAQIKSLAVQAAETAAVAKHMATIAQLQRNQTDALRRKEMPRLKIMNDGIHNGNNYIGITLINLGGKIEMLKVIYDPKDILFVCEENDKSVEPNGKIHFQWSVAADGRLNTIPNLAARLTYTDVFGYDYVQVVNRPNLHEPVKISQPHQIPLFEK